MSTKKKVAVAVSLVLGAGVTGLVTCNKTIKSKLSGLKLFKKGTKNLDDQIIDQAEKVEG